MASKRSGGNGRKKTVLRRIGNEDARQVCFSKRNRGLFSKASALALLTGAQVAAVVFTPGGKAFSFGHSSVDAVVSRFMVGDGVDVQAAAADDNGLQTLHRQHGEMCRELAERKKRKKRADEALAQERAAGDQTAAWLNPDVSDMGYEDMAAFTATLMQVKAAVSGRSNHVLLEAFQVNISRKLQVPPPPPPLQLYGASTFEFGSSSSSSANTGMEMAMPLTPTFAPGMDMHQMLMVMPPPLGLAAEVEIQQGRMAMPPPPEFPAVMGMQHMQMEMAPLEEFVTAMQGLGTNAGFPY